MARQKLSIIVAPGPGFGALKLVITTSHVGGGDDASANSNFFGGIVQMRVSGFLIV
jgi:hypothetical protein